MEIGYGKGTDSAIKIRVWMSKWTQNFSYFDGRVLLKCIKRREKCVHFRCLFPKQSQELLSESTLVSYFKICPICFDLVYDEVTL